MGFTVLISSWKCNYRIYLDIQAISTLLCLLLVLDVQLLIFIYVIGCYKNCSPEKLHFLALKSLLLPQFSTYRLRTGFIVKRKQVHIINYLGIPINLEFFFYKFLKFILQKKYAHLKRFYKVYSFFSKRDNSGILIYLLDALITSNFLYF